MTRWLSEIVMAWSKGDAVVQKKEHFGDLECVGVAGSGDVIVVADEELTRRGDRCLVTAHPINCVSERCCPSLQH
ncbi:unnamed protein product [Allacma fusca]|uniref:Uncharacterized protein n=1 Tax=Allacma fusca TaxID=39272 RepID=A0A8J2P1T0_9HEXA|nr:unnamed protein product [Allacma fusca]